MNFGIKTEDLTVLLQDGFTKRFALFYLNQAKEDYKSGLWPEEQIKWAHSHGFLADKIAAYDLNDDNVDKYLSDYDYYRLWPLNNPYRIWINDKLTLKYILPDNLFGAYLPKYYYYTEERGCLYCLDCDQRKYAMDSYGLLSLLKDKKKLAMKLVNGTASQNFYKLSFENNDICINSIPCCETDFLRFIEMHPHYCITEYLEPHPEMARIHDKIHTLRLMVINEHGNDPRIVHGYLRFGTNEHGEANHCNHSADCKANYDFCARINVENGVFGDSVLAYQNKIIHQDFHPDTKAKASGIIPGWENVKKQILNMSRYLFQAEYCGFDVGITVDGFKIMEINSHQGIGFLQLFDSLYDIPFSKQYFTERISKLNSMSLEGKTARNGILR